MIRYSSLENTAVNELFSVFAEAFSDYMIPVNMSLERFTRNMRRNEYDGRVSAGAFSDGKLVGFIMSGRRVHDGILSAYDMGTGVIPEYRSRGIAGNMIEHLKCLLDQEGVSRYVLEVIRDNERALNLYRRKGFEIRREFTCFQIDKSRLKGVSSFHVEHVPSLDFDHVKGFQDASPSWQNSAESILSDNDRYVFSVISAGGRVCAYAVSDPATGDIAQFAVSHECRGRGMGKSLLTDIRDNTAASTLRVVNVGDEATRSFLTHLDFVPFAEQYEMELRQLRRKTDAGYIRNCF